MESPCRLLLRLQFLSHPLPPTKTAPALRSAAVPDAKSFVATPGMSNLFEIQSSRLALQKASKPAVKQFAQMMVDEHTRVADALTVAAQTANETVPPQRLDSAHEEPSWGDSTAPATSIANTSRP